MTNEEIDKLEAGPELDKLVAEKVMKWQMTRPLPDAPRYLIYWCDDPGATDAEGWHDLVCDWNPSHRIDHAWQVVEKTNLFQRYLLRQVGEAWQVVDLVMDATGAYVIDWCHPIAEASTVMLAIDRAALRVVNDSAR